MINVNLLDKFYFSQCLALNWTYFPIPGDITRTFAHWAENTIFVGHNNTCIASPCIVTLRGDKRYSQICWYQCRQHRNNYCLFLTAIMSYILFLFYFKPLKIQLDSRTKVNCFCFQLLTALVLKELHGPCNFSNIKIKK